MRTKTFKTGGYDAEKLGKDIALLLKLPADKVENLVSFLSTDTNLILNFENRSDDLNALLDVVDVSASDFFLAQGLFSFLVLTALRKGDSLEDIKKDLVELGALQEPAPGEPESRSERFGELLSKFEPRLPELDASARRERAARRVVPTLSGVDYQTNLSLDVKDRFDVWSQTKAGYSPKFDDFTPVCLCSFALSDDEVFHFQVATDRLKRVLDILQAAMTELEKAEELAAQLRGKE